jgi:2-(1,2-epoxy-1,2-dihydrophenyl)acetyl-CoA isomerase
MAFESLRFAIQDGIARITLARPDRGNPINDILARELRDVAVTCAQSPEVRCILLDAEGPRFSVGGDLKALARDRAALPHFVSWTLTDVVEAIATLVKGNAPIVCSVNGVVAGGGIGLVAAADVVVASPEARFVAAFSAIGLCADTGTTYFLPRRVGPRRTSRFFLLNETWDAAQACEAGLVDEVVPAEDLAATAEAYAARFAAGPTLGYGETRRLIARSMHSTLEDQLALEAAGIGKLVTTDDAWDGITAILEKRPTVFRGR